MKEQEEVLEEEEVVEALEVEVGDREQRKTCSARRESAATRREAS